MIFRRTKGKRYERLTSKEAEFLGQALSDFEDGLEALFYEENSEEWADYQESPDAATAQSVYDKILGKHKVTDGRFEG